MPFGDGTGPLGYGPRTGRGLGFCSGYRVPGSLNPVGSYWGYGRGFGYRRGIGFGRGLRWDPINYWTANPHNPAPYSTTNPQYAAAEEKESLILQSKALEEELKAIKERLIELEKKTEDKK